MDDIISTCEPSQRSRNVTRGLSFAKTGKTFFRQFERSGALSDIDDAITNFQQAVSLTPDDHPDKPGQLNNLASSFGCRFGRTGILSDIEEAIRTQQQAISITPDIDSSKPMYLANLGNAFKDRFERTGKLDDIKEAISYQRQALLLAPDDHPYKPAQLSSLGSCLFSRFEHTGMRDDIQESIKIQQQAITLTPDDDAYRPHRLSSLGAAFARRFESTGTLSDLDSAIESFRQAVSIAPDGHPSKPLCLNGLGNSLKTQFECTGMLNSLEEAIKHLRQAVFLTPHDHPDKPMHLSNLGNALEARFGRTGILDDIEEALKNHQQAVLLTVDDHISQAQRFSNLANSFYRWFECTGVLSRLEEAIKHHRQAVSLAPKGHPLKPMYLNNLGVLLERRFEHAKMMTDLEEAIENKRLAVSLTPDNHPDKLDYLHNLGGSLRSRFELTGMQSDIEEAITSQQQAVLLTSDDHPSKPAKLNSLGTSFHSRFERTGKLSDIEEAIKYQQQAAWLTPDNHPDKPARLNNLGISFQSRFERTGILSDLEYAIENKQRAVLLTPHGHPQRPGRLYNLGHSLQSRFTRTGLTSDLDEAILHVRLAATSTVGSILSRSLASLRWARLEARRNPSSALVAYRQTIDLLPQLAWIGDPITTRHSQLTNFGDLPREAAAFALDIGRPDLALEWLEQGRSVVWNQLLNLRTPVDDLRRVHPDLCAEFTQVSHQLRAAATRAHTPNTSDDAKISLEEETQHHHRLAEKWDSLVEKIRLLSGFEDFLLPKRVVVLKEAASLGPVVVINVHRRRCDALVLAPGNDQVSHIPLEKLRYEDLEKTQKSLRQYLANSRQTQRWEGRAGAPIPVDGSRIVMILEQIYSSTVYPILRGLAMTTGESDHSNLPRIWWCPTGPLTFLPLHAACRRTRTGTDGTFNHVVSSYIPTINALLEARAVKRQPFSRLVGIAMTNTPGQHPLPGAEKEMIAIGKPFQVDSKWSFDILRNEEATGEQVMARMESSSWIHLACHAIQDEKEPTRSGFCLYDRRLTIADIVSKSFGRADLAFLSACETAAGDEKVSDEAVHITAAMLGAGYRNVIGTMWAIPDAAAPRIAAKVYGVLLSGGGPDSDRAARALHEAVKEVRESSHDSFNFWVPFVHYGA